MKNDSFEDWRVFGKPITIKNVSKSVILGILKMLVFLILSQ